MNTLPAIACRPRLVLHQHGGDLAALHDDAGHERMQQQLHAGLLAHLVEHDLERLSVETDTPLQQGLLPGRRAADGMHALGDLL